MEPAIDKIDRLVIALFGGEIIEQGEISKENEEEFFGERLTVKQKENRRIFERMRLKQDLYSQKVDVINVQKRMEAQMNELEQKQAELQAKLQATDNATDILFEAIGTEPEEIKAKDRIEPEPPPQIDAVEAPTPTAANQIPIPSITNNIQQSNDEFKNRFKNAITLGSIYDKNEENKNILFNFLLENGVNFLVGAGGSGKTYLSYHFVVYLLNNGYQVFYIDMDNPSSLIVDRGLKDKIIQIGKGDYIRYYNYTDFKKVLDNKALNIKTEASFIIKILEYIEAYKQQFKEQKVVVFIDSLQSIITDFSVEKTSSEFMHYMRRLSQSNITFVVLHHTAKQSGLFKGFTVLRDAGDMMYYIGGVQKDLQGNITDYVLKTEKARYKGAEQLQIRILGNYQFDVIDTVLDIDENTVLKLVYFGLKKHNELQKMQLNKYVRDRLEGIGNRIGRTKINEIIDKFIELKFLNVRPGDKTTVYLSLNPKSDTLKKLTEELIDEY
jgi:KaiC/GvpD/RAD55 family RecA-like ATPase